MPSFNRSMRAAAPVLLAIAAAVVPAWLDAQQRRPTRVVLTPVTRAKIPPPPTGVSRRDIPLLTAYGELGYRAAKARARTARVPRAEQEIRLGVGRSATDVTYNAPGLNRLTAANNGFIFNPPDPQIAAGPGRVLQVVNSALQMRTGTGAVVQTMDLNTFFGANPAEGLLFDPKLIYDAKPDPTNRRFAIVALQQSDGPPQVGRFWLAVSRSSNPANLSAPLWCLYAFNAILGAGTDAAWPDYPGMGTSADGLLLTFNHFRFTDRTFTFARTFILDKLTLFNNAAGCTSLGGWIWTPSGTPGDPATFTLQPVQHLNNPSSFPNRSNPAYTINTHFTSAGAANYRVIRYSNSFTTPPAPTMQIIDVPGNWANSVPPDAPQSGSTILLDTGDHRVTEAAGLNDNFWGTNATACFFAATPVACLRAVRISVGDAAGNPTGTITQQRTFGQPDSYFFWSGVAVNRDEKTVLAFHYVSPATSGRLSSWWAIKEINNTFWGSIFPFNPGTCAYTNTNRTGDYAGAETHLNKRDFWLSSERATTVPGLSGCNWDTRTILVVNGNPVFEASPRGENIADR